MKTTVKIEYKFTIRVPNIKFQDFSRTFKDHSQHVQESYTVKISINYDHAILEYFILIAYMYVGIGLVNLFSIYIDCRSLNF